MKLSNLQFLPKAIGRKGLLFGIGGSLAGIPLCLTLWYFDPLKSYPNEFVTSLIGGIITISLLLGSIVVYFSQLKEKQESMIMVLYPMSLIIFAVLVAVCGNIVRQLIYFASYYLLLGIVLFLNEIRLIISEHTIGATLLDRVTYESRKQKLPCFNEKSIIAEKTFKGNMNINKGDALLAKCEFTQDGRLLVQKLIENAEFVIYISADRPYTVVREELESQKEKIYCIDCFTNVYGFGEFKQAEKESKSYTLNPPTVKELHERLRDTRKRIVAEICIGKDWFSLNNSEIARVINELACRDAKLEKDKNIWIIYDSISSLAAVFDMEPLMKFLIHDTTVDMTIGRNTLLLMKDGSLDPHVVSRLESFCEHIFGVKMDGNNICINVNKSVDVKAHKEFCITI